MFSVCLALCTRWLCARVPGVCLYSGERVALHLLLTSAEGCVHCLLA